MTRLFGSKNNRIHLVAFVTSSATRRRHRWGMHPPTRGVDMTLDFIENHRQNIFVLHIT